MVTSLVATVGVPLLTGLALYERGGTENLRAALILIDGATELVLRANTRESDLWFALGERARELNDSARELGADEPLTVFEVTFPLVDDPPEVGPELSAHLSTKDRRDLWYFNPNVDIARLFRTIDGSTAAALKAIHICRNTAYHHGEVQADAIAAIVAVQLVSVGMLLRAVRPWLGEPLVSPAEDAERHERIGLPAEFPFALGGLADRITAGLLLDPAAIATVLSDNLDARLAGVDRGLTEAAEFLGGPFSLVSTDDAIRLVQLDQPWPGLDEARRAEVKWQPDSLREWADNTAQVRAATDAQQALSLYVAVDEPLTQFVSYLDQVLNQIDREIQAEIDRRRGK